MTAIASGFAHNLALKSDGTIAAWGGNQDGETTVPSGLRAVAIAAGGNFSLAIKSDGTVAAWGGNDAGQSSPPAGLSKVIGISAGGSHSLAIVASAK